MIANKNDNAQQNTSYYISNTDTSETCIKRMHLGWIGSDNCSDLRINNSAISQHRDEKENKGFRRLKGGFFIYVWGGEVVLAMYNQQGELGDYQEAQHLGRIRKTQKHNHEGGKGRQISLLRKTRSARQREIPTNDSWNIRGCERTISRRNTYI